MQRVILQNFLVQKNDGQTRDITWWCKVPMGPPDPIFTLTEMFKKDSDPKKVNLGVGAYRSSEGKPYVLPSVLKAEESLSKQKLDKEYLPMVGHAKFCELSAKFVFGENSELLKNNLNITVQSLSGTGSLFLGAQFIKHFFPGTKVINISTPTWPVHFQIFENSDVKHEKYRYYDPQKKWLNFDWIKQDLCKMPENSIILLHAVAHNPTGIDPSREQWDELSAIIKHKKIFPFFDMAYQGFASGDADEDAYAVRKFLQDGHQLFVAQSYAKNFGLYGERIGAIHMTTENPEEKAKVLSQLKIRVRAAYSNPPVHGARLVSEILGNPELKAQWQQEVKCMSGRIKSMRKKLVEHCKNAGSKHNWDHIVKQIGMFCFSGLTPQQAEDMIKKHHVYMMSTGRIAIAGLTDKNVEYVAHAMHDVTK